MFRLIGLIIVLALSFSANGKSPKSQKNSSRRKMVELPKSHIHDIMGRYVRVHNSSAIVKNLLTNLRLYSQKELQTIPTSLLTAKVPKAKYNPRTMTLSLANGKTMQVISVARGLYKINGKKVRYPEGFYESKATARKSASYNLPQLFSLLPAAYADDGEVPEVPEDCELWENHESPRRRHIGNVFLYVGAELSGYASIATHHFNESCQSQVESILRMSRGMPDRMSNISCEARGASNRAVITLASGRQLTHFMQMGITETSGQNNVSGSTFFHRFGRANAYVGFYSEAHGGVLYCERGSAPFRERISQISPQNSFLAQLDTQQFCEQCHMYWEEMGPSSMSSLADLNRRLASDAGTTRQASDGRTE